MKILTENFYLTNCDKFSTLDFSLSYFARHLFEFFWIFSAVDLPTFDEEVSRLITAIVDHSVIIKCPIARNRHSSKVEWLKDRQPLDSRLKSRIFQSHEGKRLYLSKFVLKTVKYTNLLNASYFDL